MLWLIRAVLVASVVLHVLTAVQLARRAHVARPESYRHRVRVQGSYAARTMRWGGVGSTVPSGPMNRQWPAAKAHEGRAARASIPTSRA